MIPLRPSGFPGYELLDSGGFRRLERFGDVTLVRHEPKAWWRTRLSEDAWGRASAEFREEGGWRVRPGGAGEWLVPYGGLAFVAKFTSSRHVGIFPEQAFHWEWTASAGLAAAGLSAARPAETLPAADRPADGGFGGAAPRPRLLNLFGYTGVASVVARRAGFDVTHVDASKPAVAWARRNHDGNPGPGGTVRFILDDARKFVAREERRGSRYEAVLLDPPSFGRGPKGEVWKVETELPALLAGCAALLSDRPIGLVLTLYSIDASACLAGYLLDDALGGRSGSVEIGEVAAGGGPDVRPLPLALYGRWTSAEFTRSLPAPVVP